MGRKYTSRLPKAKHRGPSPGRLGESTPPVGPAGRLGRCYQPRLTERTHCKSKFQSWAKSIVVSSGKTEAKRFCMN